MIKSDFDDLNHFTYVELYEHFDKKDMDPRSNIQKISFSLLKTLDVCRENVGLCCHIHRLHEGSVDASKSYHPKGMAVDFHFKGMGGNPNKVLQVLTTIDTVGGIGWYPGWNNPGFHIDMGPRRLWKKIGDEYLPLITL